MLVDVDFLDHWRTRLVVDQLGGDELAPLYIMRVWAHCQMRKSVRFEGMTASGLRSLCRFPGSAEKLESALIEAGFVVRNGNAIEVPKWAKHNASLISAWENGAKGGRPRKHPENPTETDGKPMGSNGKTHGQPKANPRETDRTRGDERRSDGIGIESKSDGKAIGVPANGKPSPPSPPSPSNARRVRGEPFDLAAVDWDRVVAMAEAVARKIPPRSPDDRRFWLKFAVMAEMTYSENWLMDSVEGVLRAKESRNGRQAHFMGVAKAKALELGTDEDAWDAYLDRIEIPKAVWKSSVLEIRK